MVEYRLYCLDWHGHITRRHELVAADDSQALVAARAQEPHCDCELWSGPRKVAVLPAGGEPILARPAA